MSPYRTNLLAEMDKRHGASFFGTGAAQPAEEQRPRRRRGRKSGEDRHTDAHKIVSISLYNEDIERIDGLVQEWKANGNPKANWSALIRYAIDQPIRTTCQRSIERSRPAFGKTPRACRVALTARRALA